MLIISLTLCKICFFDFIRVEEGVKLMQNVVCGGGGASRNSLLTCGLDTSHYSQTYINPTRTTKPTKAAE
jgi:hypothetical protein